MRVFPFFFIFAIAFLICVDTAQAQLENIGSQQLREDALNLEISPESPKPGDTVSVTLSGVSIELDASNIVWYVNSGVIARGIGVKKVSLSAPQTGKMAVVRVLITDAAGKQYEKSITINGSSVILLWESKTYTPPFFQGKAEHSTGAFLAFEAMPDFKDSAGNTVSANNLIYTWKKDEQVLQNLSGFGKNFLGFADNDFGGAGTVEVIVTSRDQKFIASDSVSITRVVPYLTFYRYSLLFGTNFNEQENSSITGSGEIGVRAVPFFFPVDPNSRFQFPELQWKLSGGTVDNRGLPYLVVQNPNVGRASGAISVSVKNPKRFGEDVPVNVGLNFE
ncbi:MAG TPA: hypothetical protein VJJ27_01660 [Candidatus Paceibacterota bacterium]